MREREARQRDQPRSRILKDDAVYEIAQQQPKDEAALSRLRTVSKGFERSNAGREILAAVGARSPSPRACSSHPRPPQPAGSNSPSVEFLRVLLKIVVNERGVAGRLIASGDDLEKLAVNGPDRRDVPALEVGARSSFGNRALELLEGQSALVYRNRRVEVVKL